VELFIAKLGMASYKATCFVKKCFSIASTKVPVVAILQQMNAMNMIGHLGHLKT